MLYEKVPGSTYSLQVSSLRNQEVLLVTSLPPFRGSGFPLVFFCCFFLLFTRVASCELPPSLLLPWAACREDDRGGFFFSSACCTETRPWARGNHLFCPHGAPPFQESPDRESARWDLRAHLAKAPIYDSCRGPEGFTPLVWGLLRWQRNWGRERHLPPSCTVSGPPRPLHRTVFWIPVPSEVEPEVILVN